MSNKNERRRYRNGEMHEWIKQQVQLGVLLAFRLSS